MKKDLLFTVAIIALCLSGCNINNNGDEHNSSSPDSQITSSTSYEEIAVNKDNVNTDGASNSENAPQEIENVSHDSLPENVVISILGHTLSDSDLSEINFGENGIWNLARYEDFVYLSDPEKNDFKKYMVDDEICGLKLTSARNVFSNDYLDNEFHEEYRCTSVAEFEGTLTMTGVLTIAEDDDANLMTKNGDITFSTEKSAFPIISGLSNNHYYSIRCGNINEGVISELLNLPLGEEITAKITVSNITLYSAMPVDAYVQCEIDSINLQ